MRLSHNHQDVETNVFIITVGSVRGWARRCSNCRDIDRLCRTGRIRSPAGASSWRSAARRRRRSRAFLRHARSRQVRKAGARSASVICEGRARVVAATTSAKSANSPAAAGRCSVRTREAIATTRSERVMSSASCEAEPSWDRVIGSSSVANIRARPRRQIESARHPTTHDASPLSRRATTRVCAN